MDTLTPAERSARMSRVRGRDSKPEMLVRRLIHAMGFRYRLHDRRLPGTPDLVFASRRRAIDGFGNKDPGKRRATQYRSPWDVLHPGRVFADKLANGGMTADFLTKRVDDYFSGRPLEKLPKAIEDQANAEQLSAEEAADDASI